MFSAPQPFCTLCNLSVVAIYAITWVGGHVSHSKKVESHALATYEAAKKKNDEMSAFAQREGLADYEPIQLRQGGPKSDVKWSFPLLPGILVVNSYYVIAPLWAEGGTKLIVCYGTSSAVICKLSKWVS